MFRDWTGRIGLMKPGLSDCRFRVTVGAVRRMDVGDHFVCGPFYPLPSRIDVLQKRQVLRRVYSRNRPHPGIIGQFEYSPGSDSTGMQTFDPFRLFRAR